LLKHLETNLFQNTVTGDETLVYSYDPKTKQQSFQRKHHHLEPRKHTKVCSMEKVVFFKSDGTVHHAYAPKGNCKPEYLFRNTNTTL
jgi:hypothetical protein